MRIPIVSESGNWKPSATELNAFRIGGSSGVGVFPKALSRCAKKKPGIFLDGPSFLRACGPAGRRSPRRGRGLSEQAQLFAVARRRPE